MHYSQLIIGFSVILCLSSFSQCNDIINNGEKPVVDKEKEKESTQPPPTPTIPKNTVMALFSPMIKSPPGPCKFLDGTRRQNHQCRRDIGLPEAIKEARRLALSHCQEQFRFDRWNCSIETRGKRNIFKKVYRETAFVYALTAASLTYSIARACAEGKMTKCQCATERRNSDTRLAFRWGGCSDNVKHGKRVTRNFLDLIPPDDMDDDEVAEMLRHDSEVGITTVVASMKDKCKCHGVSGSCSMKTCWRKLGDFNSTAAALRVKYHQAIRKIPNSKASRRAAPRERRERLITTGTYRDKIFSNNNFVVPYQEMSYQQLYYLETSPTFCSITKGRQCLHPDNCATLCCGRGYTTKVVKQIEKCRCRFSNGRCCTVICDYCEKYEDRYYCK